MWMCHTLVVWSEFLEREGCAGLDFLTVVFTVIQEKAVFSSGATEFLGRDQASWKPLFQK